MSRENTYVAIMAGGIGSRFWPVSRTAHPKQFLDILGVGKSLLLILCWGHFEKTLSMYFNLLSRDFSVHKSCEQRMI